MTGTEPAVDLTTITLAKGGVRMTATEVTVYGASDDLIEVEGALREEFAYRENYGEGDLLAFSDGTLLRIVWTTDGVWRISTIATGTADLSIVEAPAGDEDNYSDRATLRGDIRWVARGDEYVMARAR